MPSFLVCSNTGQLTVSVLSWLFCPTCCAPFPSHPSAFLYLQQGQLYLNSYGMLERSSVRDLGPPLPNPTGVVISERCQRMHEDLLDLPGNREMCDRMDTEYGATSYTDLMNTTFAIIPAGRSPATFRLGEVSVPGVFCFVVYFVWGLERGEWNVGVQNRSSLDVSAGNVLRGRS